MDIGIIGLGLIGGSLGRAILKKTENNIVYGADILPENVEKAKLLNAVNFELDESNISKLDMLIVAVYEKKTVEALDKYVPRLKSGCVVIDVCGNKKGVCAAMRKLQSQYPDKIYAGAHPMAGREFSGLKYSKASLFEKASLILTPVNADLNALSNLKKFFFELGFEKIIYSNAEKHDKMIAYTSQLAHLVSNAYIKNPLFAEHEGYSGSSFKDMTRVGGLNEVMWTELFLNNRENLIGELDFLIERLEGYKEALMKGDGEKLKGLLK